MDYNVSEEMISVCETIFDGVLEQSVELDYLLPDYCPNVFKVLRCTVTPKILSERISGSKLLVDGVAVIQILYVSDDANKLRQLEQKQAFTKTAELKEDGSGGELSISAKCDYVNCRAVNQRRLDIRGAISMKVTVRKPRSFQAVSDCDALQLHRNRMEVCGSRLSTVKDFTIKEELEIGHGKPPIQDILSYEAVGIPQDYKLLANKVICKGELLLHTLYLCSSGTQPEVIEHSLPISQIVEFEGVDEDFTCSFSFEVVKYDIDMQIENDGECHSFVAEIGVRVRCEAGRNQEVQLVDDCYSTSFETKCRTEQVRLETLSRRIEESTVIKTGMKLTESDLSGIYDILYQVSGISWSRQESRLNILCNLQLSVLAMDGEGMPTCVEQNLPCEFEVEAGDTEEEYNFWPDIRISSIVYNILSQDELELRVSIFLGGLLYEVSQRNLLTKVEIDENAEKHRNDNCALRLYFADEGESIWEIAKRYNTSVQAILEQNAIETERVTSRGMILIPIVD